jgi:hypothetical protein
MLKANRDIFVDKDNKVVAQQSTVSGTFKAAAEGAGLSEEDAARYNITPDKYAEYGLEVVQQQAPAGSGFSVNTPQPSQRVSMGAPTEPQQSTAQTSSNAPAPADTKAETSSPATSTQQPATSTAKPAATPKTHTTATATNKPAAGQPSPASSTAVSGGSTTPAPAPTAATDDKK